MSRQLCFVLVVVVACGTAVFGGGNVASRLDGGNFGPGRVEETARKFEILRAIGAGMCRVTVSENEYYPAHTKMPRPERFDALILQAYKYGVTPMILFEYYTRWNGPLGGHEKWYAVGKAFAERFAPDSAWLQSQGIRGWGVTFYSAINEPMWKANNPTPIDPADYAAALEGLADGVHAVDPALHVSPGGYQEIPLLRDNPYGPAVAHLFNNGKLSAIDIHRYYDVQYQPMYGTYRNSLQNQFDEVKKKWGITADILFYTTEFNFKKRLVDETEAARGLLTAIWDALGVVGNQGQPVTQFALPWNIFNTPGQDEHYGMSVQTDPWQPTERGRVLQMVGRLTNGMTFVQLDPRRTGVFVLEGGGKKMWVWQNRKGWTDRPGAEFVIAALPPGTRQVRVFTSEGLLRTVAVPPEEDTCTVGNLPDEQTYMFVADR